MSDVRYATQEDFDALQGKVDRLRAALKLFGMHSLNYCQKSRPMPLTPGRTYYTSLDALDWHASQPCTCGFSAALEL